jgi:hypothetical protein
MMRNSLSKTAADSFSREQICQALPKLLIILNRASVFSFPEKQQMREELLAQDLK